MPKMAEAQPITPPAPTSTGLPGTPWLALEAEVQGHLRSDDQCEDTNDLLQERALDQRGGLGADPGPQEDAQGHPGEYRPLHRTLAVVFEHGIDRVNTMVANDVPTARWVSTEASKPCRVKTAPAR